MRSVLFRSTWEELRRNELELRKTTDLHLKQAFRNQAASVPTWTYRSVAVNDLLFISSSIIKDSISTKALQSQKIGWLINVLQLVEWETEGGNGNIRRNLPQFHFIYHKSQLSPVFELELPLWKPPTNSMNYEWHEQLLSLSSSSKNVSSSSSSNSRFKNFVSAAIRWRQQQIHCQSRWINS